MNGIASRFVRYCVGLLGLVTLAWVLTGHAAKPAHHRFPLPTDWTHHHLIFSQPATPELARLVGNDPRFWQQMERRKQRLLATGERLRASESTVFSFSGGAPRSAVQGDWSEDLGSGGSVGAGTYPAKFAFDSSTADCVNDFVVFGTGLTGSATQASIVAYNNLYSGCGGTVPSVYWAYDTSQVAPPVPGAIKTSPVLSRDGTQIAFVQTDGFGAARLVLLKWAASNLETISTPGFPLSVLPSAYALCVAPCMTTFDLRDRNNVVTDDKTSSIFYDYSGDTAWVGDSRGLLHKFNPVFTGTPAQITGVWPVQVSPLALGSPVHDQVSGNVIVGGVGDGFLYRVDPNTGTATASGQLDFGVGLVAGPVVDSTNGVVYVSASSDSSFGCSGGTTDCAAVYQLTTSFAAADTGVEVIVGTSTDPSVSTPNPLYNGFFDSTYLNSANGTGNYYVCGNTGANPTLYQIQILAGVPTGTVAPVSALTPPADSPPCSPVTDFSNLSAIGGTSEHLYVGVQSHGKPRPCAPAAGCVISFMDTPWKPSAAYTVGQEILVFSSFDPNALFVNVVVVAGTTAATPPAHWPDSAPAVTINGSVHFMTQGVIDAGALNFWVKNKAYNLKNRVIDSNGNVEFVTAAGTSGSSTPVWSTTPGTTTVDGTGMWLNLGAYPVAGIKANGGSSAIIIDNAVGSGTLPGASQVYFSTLADQTCTTSGGTGGCAIQASQSGLQ